MERQARGEPRSEQQLNELLRAVDWRFLLRRPGVPRLADMSTGAPPEALREVAEAIPSTTGDADLVVLGYPSRAQLRRAHRALGPAGEVACLWSSPRPFGTQRARARLERAGFADVRLFWPGPTSSDPDFWLRLGDSAARRFVFAERPPRSALGALLRPAWRAADRLGALAPICALARRRPDRSAGSGTAPADPLLSWDPQLLLTGGSATVNKVVGLSFRDGAPAAAAKFARIAKSDSLLDDEAEVLRHFDPAASAALGIPRLLATGERCGRRGIVESAVSGQTLDGLLSETSFPDLLRQVTRWLIDLAAVGPVRSAEMQAELTSRTVRAFAALPAELLAPNLARRATGLAEGIGDVPLVPMHRDLKPWNLLLDRSGRLGALDWEDAEVHGLPGVDLAFFIATAAFLIDGVLEDPADTAAYVASQRRMLDPSTPLGGVAATCTAEYCRSLEVSRGSFDLLRLLCWMIQAVNYHDPQPGRGPGPPDSNPFGTKLFVDLVANEVDRLEAAR